VKGGPKKVVFHSELLTNGAKGYGAPVDAPSAQGTLGMFGDNPMMNGFGATSGGFFGRQNTMKTMKSSGSGFFGGASQPNQTWSGNSAENTQTNTNGTANGTCGGDDANAAGGNGEGNNGNNGNGNGDQKIVHKSVTETQGFAKQFGPPDKIHEPPPPNSILFISVACGEDHTLIASLSMQQVWAMGSNIRGQCGIIGTGKTTPTIFKSATLIPRFSEVAMANAPGMGNTAMGHTSSTFKTDISGASGPGPTIKTKSGALSTEPIIQVAAAAQHSLALDRDGGVYAFGGNERGQLGFDPAAHPTLPEPKLIVSLADRRVRQVATAAYHSVVLL
jgi:hypothetical protein